MSTNFFHDKAADRVHLAASSPHAEREIAHAEHLKKCALMHINDYFDCVQKEWASLDAIYIDCFSLTNVVNYLADDPHEDIIAIRKIIIKNHISAKIKMCIDSKE